MGESEKESEQERSTGTINKSVCVSVAIIKKRRHKYKCSKEPQNKHKIHTARRGKGEKGCWEGEA